jgi:uncharacterized protein (TIGR02145 family)
MTLILIHLITHKSNCQNSEIGNNISQSMPSHITLGNSPDEDILSYGGQDYTTKIMPDGKRWMTQNLNIGIMIPGVTNMSNNGVIEKYCYNNDAAKCTLYGGLYQWEEIMQYTSTEGTLGICPASWHLPTDAEWTALENELPSPQQASRLAGNAALWVDNFLDKSPYFATTGFEALPAGERTTDGLFKGQGYYVGFWSSSQSIVTNARDRWLNYSDVVHFYDNGYNKAYGISVRCIQD